MLSRLQLKCELESSVGSFTQNHILMGESSMSTLRRHCYVKSYLKSALYQLQHNQLQQHCSIGIVALRLHYNTVIFTTHLADFMSKMLFLVTCAHSHTFQLALSHVLIAKNCYDSGNLAQNHGLPTKDSLPQGNQLKWLCVWQFSNCGLCMWRVCNAVA